MILKLAHVTYSNINYKLAINRLFELGYKLNIKEIDLYNSNIKKKLMTCYDACHDLYLFSHDDHIDIEITQYPNVGNTCSSYFPLMPHFFFDGESCNSNSPHNNKKEKDVFIQCPAYINNEINDRYFNTIIYFVADLDSSVKFWNSLGFSLVTVENNYIMLRLVNIFSTSDYHYDIILIKKEGINASNYLDDVGLNSISLLCSSLKTDVKNIQNFKHATDVDRIVVGSEKLLVMFIVGPNHEVVELYQIDSNNV